MVYGDCPEGWDYSYPVNNRIKTKTTPQRQGVFVGGVRRRFFSASYVIMLAARASRLGS